MNSNTIAAITTFVLYAMCKGMGLYTFSRYVEGSTEPLLFFRALLFMAVSPLILAATILIIMYKPFGKMEESK